jgi:hypothetical protein
VLVLRLLLLLRLLWRLPTRLVAFFGGYEGASPEAAAFSSAKVQTSSLLRALS